jgi:hypothetical protein
MFFFFANSHFFIIEPSSLRRNSISPVFSPMFTKERR